MYELKTELDVEIQAQKSRIKVWVKYRIKYGIRIELKLGWMFDDKWNIFGLKNRYKGWGLRDKIQG